MENILNQGEGGLVLVFGLVNCNGIRHLLID
jgi:hypothetical protein